MTIYELIKQTAEQDRERLMKAGIIPQKWRRYIAIYEYYLAERARGVPKMDIYCGAEEKFFLSEPNVRRTIAMLGREV